MKALANTVAAKLNAAGVNTDTIPQVIAANAPEVKAKAADLNKNIDGDFARMQKEGAIQHVRQLQVELQYLISQGLIKDPRAAVNKLKAQMDKLGVKDSDL